MSELVERLKEKLHITEIQRIPISDSFSLLSFTYSKNYPIQFLMTDGLSTYDQPVPEKYKAHQNIELYFALPSYWDLKTISMEWPKLWLEKLVNHLTEKQTWFGTGHTIPNGNPVAPFSDTIKQSYLFLSEPILFNTELTPLYLRDKWVNFLAVIPIFEDEFDFKMGKGTYKLQKKFSDKGITELVDEYRMTSLKNKWRFFK